jgi:MFS family permease
MSPLAVALLAFACFFGGALLGMYVRDRVPEHHLSDDSKRLLQLGLGIIGTMAGLVLGLLVGSATSNYNAQRSELLDMTSKVVLLDRLLVHYGPEANGARAAMRVAVQQTLDKIWPQHGAGSS